MHLTKKTLFFLGGEVVEMENKAIWTESKVGEDWTEEDLREFEKTGKRLITEALHWNENATNSIRAVYTGTSRTTTWRHKNKMKH